MVSCTLRDRSISRFVSSTIDAEVPVNRGGACGGFLNACGAIVTVVSGLNAVGVGCRVGLETRGRIWAKIADALVVNRAGRARMRAMAAKRMKEVRKSFKDRETARLTTLKVTRERKYVRDVNCEIS